jgi:hypothetical protein
MRRDLNNYKPKVAQENVFLQKHLYSNKLSINDLKLFKAILSKVKYNDSLFDDMYEINYSTLDIAGVPKKNRYNETEKSLIKLMNTFVTIRLEDRERIGDSTISKSKGTRKLGLIKNDWVFEKKTSKIIISISDVLKPFFLELADKEYTIYNLENISSFSSVYELKLYELFAKWKNRGFFNITLTNLKEYLSLEDKYPRYPNFKARVIEKFIDTISKSTNLDISYRELKDNGDIITTYGVGNKVYSIEFLISDKNDFDASSFVGKSFSNGDGKNYIVLSATENQDDVDLLDIKLFDKTEDKVAKLIKPINKRDFIKCVK